MSIYDIVQAMLPFQAEQKPYVLPISYSMKPRPITSQLITTDSQHLLACRDLTEEDAPAIVSFLQEHFYPKSLGYTKTLTVHGLGDAIRGGTIYGSVCYTHSSPRIKLVGVALARILGALCFRRDLLGEEPVSLIDTMAVHPDYRKQGLPNQLLRQVYNQGFFRSPCRKVYLFRVDDPSLLPFRVAPLHQSSVFGYESVRRSSVSAKRVSITQEHLHGWKADLYQKDPHALWIQPETMPSEISVWQTQEALVILRDLQEVNAKGKPGAEVLWTQGFPSAVQQCLDATPFLWFESNRAITEEWTAIGVTTIAGFHLHYGSPMRRSVAYC